MADYYYNFPPITVLTQAQQAALNEPEQIALSGGPGTGKSFVSMWRHISNHNAHRKSLLLTYATTLKRYIKACCHSKNVEASKYVGTSLRNKSITQNQVFDEVIIDEAQDLDPGYFTAICSPVSYGADDSQILYPQHSSSLSTLGSLFPNNVDYVLDKNFRCTKEIMLFVRQAFPAAAISLSMINNIDRHGEKPSLLVGKWGRYDDMPNAEISAILRIISELRNDTVNIGVLLPWKNSVKKYAAAIGNSVDDISYYFEDSTEFPNGCPPLKNVHVTTFKSAKGLEFDIVIIPDYNKMSSIVGNYNIEWQDFYVGCTRAKNFLFLISNTTHPSLNAVVDVESI